MTALWITIGIVVFLLAAVLIAAYVCFYITFYVPESKRVKPGEFVLPPGEEFEPYREKMTAWNKEVSKLPCEHEEIRSFDGLILHARYYQFKRGAPIEIMFHGYRGNAERDLCGGIQRCFTLKRNVLLVDQRASGSSGGKVITFGVFESRDCVDWVRFAANRWPESKLIITGISMGASTVLMAAAEELPPSVVGVIADCGFTTAKDIICKCVKDMKLPTKLVYPFIRLGALLYGKFDPEENSAVEAVQKTRLPVIFFHGEKDNFVPYLMSVENYCVCHSPKRLVGMPEAGHGMSYLVEPERYLHELRDFEKIMGINDK